MTSEWKTNIGDIATREQLKELYGGAPFGGIEPSARTPNVLIFMDPVQAKANGYVFDGWTDDGRTLFYTGEGRFGDQLMKDGNRAIAEHVADGRALRMFIVAGKVPNTNTKLHRYLGEFRVDQDQPSTQQEALDRSGELRTVFVFKLWPLDEATPRDDHMSQTGAPPALTTSQVVDLEQDTAFEFPTSGAEPTTAQKREAQLVKRFKLSRGKAKPALKRLRIRPAGELRDQWTDVYDPATKTLYEAKGTATREAVRMAIGQLLDYRRHATEQIDQVSVLLPHRPSDDLCLLIGSLGMRLTYEEPDGQFTTVGF